MSDISSDSASSTVLRMLKCRLRSGDTIRAVINGVEYYNKQIPTDWVLAGRITIHGKLLDTTRT